MAVEAFEGATTDYLNLKLAGIVFGTTASVVDQKSLRRRSLRVLQDTNTAVELEVFLTGESQTMSSDEFGKQIRSALNQPGYVDLVKSSHVAFDGITSVDAGVTASQVANRDVDMPDTENQNRRLQIGMIIAIVLGLLIAAVSIGAGAYYLVRSGSNNTPSIMTPIQEYPAETVGKSPEIVPVTSAPSAADSSVGGVPPATSEVESSFNSEGNNNSAMKSLAGESEMEGYSVAAGHVEGGTAGGGPSVGEATGTSASGDEMSSHAMSSLKQNMVSRTVIAPPGKLGIVIDTTLEGPVVHKVNGQSPLEGSLFPGDIIVAIDDVDTRAMSASAITALMVRTANLRRTLTVLSEDNST